MLVGAALLALEVALTNYIDRRNARLAAIWPTVATAPGTAAASAAPPARVNAFQMVFKTRYLLLMAFMLLLLNTVNTTGEYVLGSIVKDAAIEHVGGDSAAVQREIGAFYSTYFTYVNALGLFLQLFVVSRVVKYLGVPVGVVILPIVSLTAYGIISFIPFLHAVLTAKVAENATDYSLNNTVRNMLFLPCTREQKYSANRRSTRSSCGWAMSSRR